MNLDLSFLNAKLVLPVDYKSVEFWLVGAGGTGSFMAMNLARLAFELKMFGKQVRIVIVDPDRVETGNIPRSNFCFAEVGLNKAETLAGRVSRAWGIEVGFVKEGFRPALLQSKNDDWQVQSSNSSNLTVKGILGISEFEKAVSGMKSSGKTDGGETARTISYLLNWMQDNRDVLVFATANDVRDLESEQFRIGRFSYIHFVDLPTKEDRQEIFRVHLSKRALKPEDFDLDVLAEKSEQFSGAEIEGAVKDAVLEAFIDRNRAAETKDVVTAIGIITPTAEMMKTKIDEIREWAKNNIKGSRNTVQHATGSSSARVLEI